MPKHTITFDSVEKIPVGLQQFANGLTVDVWVNANDLAVAGELNPSLDAQNKTLIQEKRDIKTQYDALKQVSTDTSLDTAKIIIENETLKRQVPSADDLKLITAVKTVFKDIPVSEVETKLPTLLQVEAKAAQYEKRSKHEELFNASGYTNKTVFLDLLENPKALEGIDGEPYAEVIAGTTGKGLFVKVKDANGVPQPTKFEDFTKTNDTWKAYEPALTVGKQQNGQQFIRQNPPKDGQPQTQKTAAEIANEKHNTAQKAKPNAFSPFTASVIPTGGQQQ